MAEPKLCFCGNDVDPFLLNMCKRCFMQWTEMKTHQWIRESIRNLERVKASGVLEQRKVA